MKWVIAVRSERKQLEKLKHVILEKSTLVARILLQLFHPERLENINKYKSWISVLPRLGFNRFFWNFVLDFLFIGRRNRLSRSRVLIAISLILFKLVRFSAGIFFFFSFLVAFRWGDRPSLRSCIFSKNWHCLIRIFNWLLASIRVWCLSSWFDSRRVENWSISWALLLENWRSRPLFSVIFC